MARALIWATPHTAAIGFEGRALRRPSRLPASRRTELRPGGPLRVPTDHGVDVVRVQPEDAAASVHGQDALGDSPADGLHADPDAGSGRGQRLVGPYGHGTVPSRALAGPQGHKTGSTYSRPQPPDRFPVITQDRFRGERRAVIPCGGGVARPTRPQRDQEQGKAVLVPDGRPGDPAQQSPCRWARPQAHVTPCGPGVRPFAPRSWRRP